MAGWRGSHGGVWWVYTNGAMDPQTVRTVVDHVIDFGKTAPEGHVYLTVAWGSEAPPPAARKEMAEALNHYRTAYQKCLGHAFVANSIAMRGALTAVGWFVNRPYQERIFSAPEPAFAWFEMLSPAIDLDAVVAAMKKEVAPEAWWQR